MEKETTTTDQIETGAQKEQMHVPAHITERHASRLGPILGVLLIVLVLILGGLYLWGASLSEEVTRVEVPLEIPNNEPETPRAQADVQILNTVSPSDSLEALEADIESTDLNELDAELDAIERELEAALTQ